MNVSMPVTRSTGNFQHKGSAFDAVFPPGAGTKYPERLDQNLKHCGEVGLVRDCEREHLQGKAADLLHVVQHELEAPINPAATSAATDLTEPISAVNGNGDRGSAGHTDN